jgi:Phosphodiester glycosidase
MYRPLFFNRGAANVVPVALWLVSGSCTPLPASTAETSSVAAPRAGAPREPAIAGSSLPNGGTGSQLAASKLVAGGSPASSAPSVPSAWVPSPAMNTPPASVSPPFSSTASSGDGQWRIVGAEKSGVNLWHTVLHPNERSRFVSVDVVSVDLRHFRLAWVVGSGDVGASLLVGKQIVGVLDPSWAGDVVAVFNGGFQARHGYWGQFSHGVTLVRPKPDGCGLALYDDDSVALGSYDKCNRRGLVSYRQTPPCLVANGELDPRLLSGKDGIWAGKSSAEKTRRRSAAGLTANGETLYYVVGVETAAIDLARALKALGAEHGLQLDINWNWTRFFPIERVPGEVPSLGVGLIEGMVADKGEYVTRPSKRDFFAIVRRSSEP